MENLGNLKNKGILWFLALFSICIFLIYYVGFLEDQPQTFLDSFKLKWSNNSHACQFHMNPWDPSISRYLREPKPIQCDVVQPNVTYMENGVIKLNAQFYYEITKCRYRYFENKLDSHDMEINYGEWRDFNGTLLPKKDFVHISCYNGSNKEFYDRHWNLVVPKTRNLYTRTIENSNIYRPSVIMFGIDSMSRSNFIRRFPKTLAFLNASGFVDMKRHVKIADNTLPNTIGILTGKYKVGSEYKDTERPHHVYFDDYPFIWKEFSQQSYATFYGEDRPDMGTFVEVVEKLGAAYGFKKAPVDHYMRPFWLSAHNEKLMPKYWCYDGEPAILPHLNYLETFIRRYKGKRKFAYWFAQDIGHNELNDVGGYDPYFEEFFRRNGEYLFEDSIVIIFGDHGFRMGEIRGTFIGRLEASLPLLMIRLPEKFQRKYPHLFKNLQYNSELMTTHFDLYSTLKQIVEAKFDHIEKDTTLSKYSLFGPIPSNRTCQQALVPDGYCPCFQEARIPPKKAQKAVEILLDYINHLLDEYNHSDLSKEYQCDRLEFQEIERASLFSMNMRFLESEKDERFKLGNLVQGIEESYRVTFKVKAPSSAVFEGVVKHNLDKDVWLPSSEIDRVNRYGNTSHCVRHDLMLRKLCYCSKR